MEERLFDAQKTGTPTSGRPHNLYASIERDGGERGANWRGHTRRSSIYTRAIVKPRATIGIAAGLAAAVGLAVVARGHKLRRT